MIAIDEIRPGDAAVGAPAAVERIPRGHKIATAPIEAGAPVRKFGQIIGFASKPIAPGQWVHEHNCVVRISRATIIFARTRGRQTDPAGREPGDLPGLPPRQRQGGHAQLSRHPHLGELLGDRGAADRARGRAVGHARRLSQRRRRHRARPRHRLRHGRARAKASTRSRARNGATPPIPTWAAW